jgi:uncharacterized protein YjiS (DUF1127 family)
MSCTYPAAVAVIGRSHPAVEFDRSRSPGAGRRNWGALIYRCWVERCRQRQALAELDDRRLRDLGLTRAQVELETGKPFWRA